MKIKPINQHFFKRFQHLSITILDSCTVPNCTLKSAMDVKIVLELFNTSKNFSEDFEVVKVEAKCKEKMEFICEIDFAKKESGICKLTAESPYQIEIPNKKNYHTCNISVTVTTSSHCWDPQKGETVGWYHSVAEKNHCRKTKQVKWRKFLHICKKMVTNLLSSRYHNVFAQLVSTCFDNSARGQLLVHVTKLMSAADLL